MYDLFIYLFIFNCTLSRRSKIQEQYMKLKLEEKCNIH